MILRRIFNINFKYLKLTKFDLSNKEGIENERIRKATLTTLTSIISKVISTVVGLITVPLTLNYLGIERYGLWMTISSIIMMLVFADFGLGNGLVNALSIANGNNDKKTAQKSVSSVFFMLCVISIAFLIIFVILFNHINWNNIFNVTSEIALKEIGPAVTVFFIIFILNIQFGIVRRIQIGYQDGYIANNWLIGSNIISLLVILIVIKLKLGLPWLIISTAGVQCMFMGLNMIYEFIYVRPWLRPRLSSVNWKIGARIMQTGVIFTLITLANIVGSSIDNIIIAKYMGISHVTSYSIVQKLFSIMIVVSFVSAPLWPAFGESISRNDYSWVKRTFIQNRKLTVLITLILCLPLLLFGRTLIHIWTGSISNASIAVISGFAALWIVSGFAQTAINIMQTEHFLKKLLLVTIIYSLLSISLKIILVPYYGPAGIIWAGGISYALFFTIPITIIIRLKLKSKLV